jgi:predicted RNA-binding protein with PIN domain
VLERALAVARQGEAEQPPIPGPTRLAPYLRFAKFPPKALDVARRVLDDDPGFRARVREAVDLERVGAAGRLLLEQPEGWEDELATLEAATATDAAEAQESRQERRAAKQLEITRDSLDRATRRASTEAARASRLEHDLHAERQARQRLEARVAALDEVAEQARVERRRAVAELKAMESRLNQRTAEVRAARQLLDELEAEGSPSVVVGEGDGRLDPTVDREAIARSVATAARSVDAAAAALARATAAVGAAADDGGVVPTGTSARLPRRRPVRLPVGMFDDSVEAADALLAVDDMLVLVDGYNVSLAGWPDLDLDVQRARLVDGLAAVEARTGARSVVVFDGAATGADLPPESRLRSVQVRFTEPGVEADDAILAAVEQMPPDRPVTVVSSDNRVRRGAVDRGANVLSSAQLLAVVRRS